MEINLGDDVAPEAVARHRDNSAEDRTDEIDDRRIRDLWHDDDGICCGDRSGDDNNRNTNDIETKTMCSWQYIFDEVW